MRRRMKNESLRLSSLYRERGEKSMDPELNLTAARCPFFIRSYSYSPPRISCAATSGTDHQFILYFLCKKDLREQLEACCNGSPHDCPLFQAVIQQQLSSCPRKTAPADELATCKRCGAETVNVAALLCDTCKKKARRKRSSAITGE